MSATCDRSRAKLGERRRGPPACVLPLSMSCKLLVSARVSESCSELKSIFLKGELI